MSANRGWVSYGPGGKADLPDDERNRVEQAIRQREKAKGALLAVVTVRVYEHDEEPYVTFPPEAILGVETDDAAIAEVVSRARTQLTSWR